MPKIFSNRFVSFSDFLVAANGTSTLSDAHRASRRGREYLEFAGTASWHEAENLAINGVPALEARIMRLSEALEQSTGANDVTRIEYDVYGGSVDVDLYLSGESECMTRFETESRPGGNILSICVSAATNCRVSTAVIERRGAAVIGLIDLLETSGYRLELSVMDASISKDKSVAISTRIELKSSCEALDITRICYALAHPSFQRRHMFALNETLPAALRNSIGICPGRNYGTPYDNAPADVDLYVRSDAISRFDSDESALGWIQETLVNLGVKEA